MVVITVVLFGCAATVWDLHRTTIAEKQLATANLGVVLAEQTLRYVQLVDLVLQEVRSRAEAMQLRTPDEFRSQLGTAAMKAYLRERLTDLPQANGFGLITAGGRILVTSRSRILPDIDLSDRDYFRHFLEHDDPKPFVSQPAQNRTTGTRTVFIARRINGPQHEFLGLVLGIIDLPFVADFYMAINLPPGASVALLRSDGLVLVRHPPDQTIRRVPPGSPWYKLAAGPGGTYRSRSAQANAAVLVSVHPLRGWPLVITTAMQEQFALATWRRQATMLATGGIAAVIGFAVLFAALVRQFRHQEAQTERLTRTAAALRVSEARVRDFAEMSSDWFWEQDADLRFTWISDTSPSRYTDDSTYRGKTRWEVLGADPTSPPWAEHKHTLEARRPFRNLRYERYGVDKRLHHLSINGNPMFDAGGAFIGYRGTGTDVTAQVKVEAELLHAKERAEEASRMKSEFLANMSHELRTPLNAIIGFSELIRDQPFGRVGEHYVAYATDIHAAGCHLLDLINDVLDLSKIEAGHYELADEVIDLGQIVRSALGMLSLRHNGGSVRIEDTTRHAGVMVRCDRRAMKQVVINLVGNAVKFTAADGLVSLHVEPQDDGGVALVISDTGIGIGPEALRELCQPFRQADASIGRRFGGSGLGLAISRRLLMLHGGTLELASIEGKGTSARVILPAWRAVTAAAAVPQPALSA